MRVIGYVRVSTAGQADEGVSLDAQEAKIRAWSDLNSADAVVVYRDEGLSGSRSDNRPGLAAAMEDIGKGDVLVAYSLSRLSRSTRDTLELADALAKKDADLVSLSERVDTTTAAGKMVFRLLAVLAEFERDQVSDRTRFALAHKRSQGQKTGGDVPFGFRARKGQLVRHAKEQKTVSQILDLHRKGLSFRAIGKELKAAGMTRRDGSLDWHPEAVRRIVQRMNVDPHE